MAVVDFFEGMETWDWNTQSATPRYQGGNFGSGGTNQWGGAFGKFGSRGMRNDSSGGGASMWLARAVDKDGTALAFTEFGQQVHYFQNDTTSQNKLIMGVAEDPALVTRHLELFDALGGVSVAHDLLIARGGTVLTTVSGVLLPGQFNFIELIGKVHDTTGYYHVRVNGVVVATVTGADTRNAGTGTCGAHWFGNTNVTGFFDGRWDDYAFWLNPSSSGDYLGDGHEVAVLPNAAGNYTQFNPSASTNVSNVDDAYGSVDSDTTYNSEATVGDKDTFNFPSIPTTPGLIHGVVTSATMRKDDSGARTARQLARISSTDYEGASVALLDTYSKNDRWMPVSPASSVAWTEAEFNAAEFGYKVQA